MTFDNASPCRNILDNRSDYIDSLYNSCFEKVKKMVMSNSGTEDDAHDIFQDAFIILFKKCREENFVLSCHPCTYLFSTSYNRWLKELKRRGKAMQDKPELTDENMDDEVNAHTERERLVAKHFLLLQERCRQILQFGCIEGLPGKEVAEKLGLTYGYYRVAKQRCLDNFFKALNNDGGWNDLKS